jgi:hypothetical protein
MASQMLTASLPSCRPTKQLTRAPQVRRVERLVRREPMETTMDVKQTCIDPYQYEARITTDAEREAVINVLDLCWSKWAKDRDVFTMTVYKHNCPAGARSFREAMQMMGNEQLASLLYDVHDNGDLAVTTDTLQ